MGAARAELMGSIATRRANRPEGGAGYTWLQGGENAARGLDEEEEEEEEEEGYSEAAGAGFEPEPEPDEEDGVAEVLDGGAAPVRPLRSLRCPTFNSGTFP